MIHRLLKNTSRIFRKKYLLINFYLFFFSSCQLNPTDSTSNSWNMGKITIATDENLKDITEQLTQIYEHENTQAAVALKFQPEDKIVHDFMNGTVRSMIISRTLTNNERAVSKQNQQVEIEENIFAYSAVALIANRSFKDSVIDITSIKNYLQPGSSTRLVFDNKQSGIPKLIMQKTGIGPELFKNALVVNNSDEVVDYVRRTSNAIGFISFNGISDTYDARAKEILSSVKLLAIRRNDSTFPISQESIYDFAYPLQYPINIVLGNNPELVGKGFTNFLCREKASKILLKAGLVPRFMATRRIIVHDTLKIN